MINRLKKDYERLIEELSQDTDIRYKDYLLDQPETFVLDNLIIDLKRLDSYYNCEKCRSKTPKAFCCQNHDLELTSKDLEILEMIRPELFETFSRLPILAQKHGGLWHYGDNFERIMAQKANGECIFLMPRGEGCYLHRFALERGMNPIDVKPYICSLFPIVVLVIEDRIVITTFNEDSAKILDCGDNTCACLAKRGKKDQHVIIRSRGILTRMFGEKTYAAIAGRIFGD